MTMAEYTQHATISDQPIQPACKHRQGQIRAAGTATACGNRSCLMVLAGLTPPEWEISIVDENLGAPDYADMPRPDLVGITAFTSQANRAYGVAAHFRRLGVPVIMGGIHTTMCQDEVMEHVDSVVTGEAEDVWPRVLEDARNGRLKRRYDGGLADIRDVPLARHDLLTAGYACRSHSDYAWLST